MSGNQGQRDAILWNHFHILKHVKSYMELFMIIIYVTQSTLLWILGGIALIFVVVPLVMMHLIEESMLVYNSHFTQL